MQKPQLLHTPDGRYIIVRGRLWRATNPNLSARRREELQAALMAARRAVRNALRINSASALRAARAKVNAAKIDFGERGSVWWEDGVKDYNRHLVKNSPYAAWYETHSRRGNGRRNA